MNKRILLVFITVFTLILSLSNYLDVKGKEDIGTLNIVAKNLSFRDNVCIKFAVDTKDVDAKLLVWSEEDARNLGWTGFTYGSQTKTLSTVGIDLDLSENYLIYDYTNLSAKEMTDNVYVRCYLDGKYGEVEKYSILQYSFNMLNKTGEDAIDENLRNLIIASLAQGAAA